MYATQSCHFTWRLKATNMNDDYCFLQWDDVQSGKNVTLFQRKLLPPSPIFMKKAVGYFERPVNFYQITPCHIPENSILQSLLWEISVDHKECLDTL